ncbi:hypothetical protein [Pseudozobellia thermophila]|uniref:D-glucuronyl C5-epimerase C-terminal domain-containing protein n=1 Tax=Pseudozobellia thermophila TaxID=192903 RepID=A0A1M6GAD8_9FLAO|nr:hypothetical protein [Pseudozobellia thermophila]SHJ06898.1 hypothetical protein SAMN04488513_102738 [Pseudozobellia thermophila]
MKWNKCAVLGTALVLLAGCQKKEKTQTPPVVQKNIGRVDSMPFMPEPFKILDFKELALAYDSIVYDGSQTGEYWPLIWKDGTKKNFDQETFGIYTALGDTRQGPDKHQGMFHESLNTISSVLGASLVGLDKSDQNGENYVGMLKNYFNSETGWDIVMNNTCPEVALLGGGYGRDWWYDVYPNLLFYGVANFYPDQPDFEYIQRSVADRFQKADSVLAGNYHHTFFDYGALEAKDNWICHQEDAAAGHAYVLYAAYQRFGDLKYLKAAKSSIEALLSQKENRFYEILMPFGAYVAARLNAEEGTSYDYHKILDWTFNGTSVCREGWGVLLDNWNGYDVSGLVGSTIDHGGFAFLMNTYDTMWPLVPLVRYDPRYATAIGKWMLNAANASKFFYPYEMADEHQTLPDKKEVTKGVIAYEGLIKKAHLEGYSHLQAPIAIGDGPHWTPDNPEVSQFSVYGSGHVGIAGAIIEKTNVPGILKLDCLATDFYRKESFPTFLLYNPHEEGKTVKYVSKSEGKVDLYDAIRHRVIAKGVDNDSSIAIPPKEANLIVEIPAGSPVEQRQGKFYVGDVVVAYQ